MRIPRSIQLYQEAASVHLIWRCHNKEYYLRPNAIKALYMDTVTRSLKKGNVAIHSYCVMDNHYHQSTSYNSTSFHLSKYMRHAHGIFGSQYNRIHKRSGKVAEARPKTSLIQNTEHEMRVHFYIEANPIRAGICSPEQLKNYKFNSFRFYAYGIKDEYTKLLTLPQWYLELGSTQKERQRTYRKLFYEYLNEQSSPQWNFKNFEQAFIGSGLWRIEQERRVTRQIKNTS